MNTEQTILKYLSSQQSAYLADIRDNNPDTSLDELQTAAWKLVHGGEVAFRKDWKLSLATIPE